MATAQTIQEEIREGMAEIMDVFFQVDAKCVKNNLITFSKGLRADFTNEILTYLNDNDVVIKVDRELPDLPMDSFGFTMSSEHIKGVYARDKQYEDAGYVAVEPLIKT